VRRPQVTLGTFAGMGMFTVAAIAGVQGHSFVQFFASFVVVFLLAGMGNGSTYRMIPSIFAALGRREAEERGVDPAATALRYRRESAAVIGIAGAVGACGGFLVQLVLRQSATAPDFRRGPPTCGHRSSPRAGSRGRRR
jgi:MFS transporter, NNP family, nitrate/nitrite transporter